MYIVQVFSFYLSSWTCIFVFMFRYCFAIFFLPSLTVLCPCVERVQEFWHKEWLLRLETESGSPTAMNVSDMSGLGNLTTRWPAPNLQQRDIPDCDPECRSRRLHSLWKNRVSHCTSGGKDWQRNLFELQVCESNWSNELFQVLLLGDLLVPSSPALVPFLTFGRFVIIYHHIMIMIRIIIFIIISLCLLSGLLVLSLPETLNTRLPDTIEEVSSSSSCCWRGCWSNVTSALGFD